MVAASTHAEISTRMITQPPTAAAANENDEKATVALLANPNTPLSERDPEAAAAQDAFARHPLTGAFTEPAVEAAFAVGFFRDAFPLHALLFAAGAIVYLFTLFGSAWRDDVLLLIISLVCLVGRVRLHRMQDQVRSQWLGSWLWTGSVVLGVALDVSDYVNDSDRTCTAVRKLGVYVFPLLYLALALVNGSHGLGFLHKGALLLFLVETLIMLYGSCGELALALSMGGALAVGYIVAHLVELRMRREFAEKRRAEERQEQLMVHAERLQYEFNLLSSSRPPSADDNFSEVCRGLQSGEASGLPPPGPSSPALSISSFSSDGYWDRRPSQLLLRNGPTARAEHRERELLRDAQRCGPRTWAVLRLLLLGLSQEGSSPFSALDIDVVRQIMYHVIVTRLSFV